MDAVRKYVRKSIQVEFPAKIPELLLTQNRAQTCATLQTVMAQNSEAAHRFLETKYRALQLRLGSTIYDGITQNHSFRRRMMQVQYPNITIESKSIRFSVDILEIHDTNRNVSQEIQLVAMPEKRKILLERLQEESFAMRMHPNPSVLSRQPYMGTI